MEAREEKSCQTYCYAYLNELDPEVSITEHEGCSMGMLPLQARLPENWGLPPLSETGIRLAKVKKIKHESPAKRLNQ